MYAELCDLKASCPKVTSRLRTLAVFTLPPTLDSSLIGPKLLIFCVTAEAPDFLRPCQLVVATSCGSEAFVHATKMTVKNCSEHGRQGVLTADFENAFKQQDRSEDLVQDITLNSGSSRCWGGGGGGGE